MFDCPVLGLGPLLIDESTLIGLLWGGIPSSTNHCIITHGENRQCLAFPIYANPIMRGICSAASVLMPA